MSTRHRPKTPAPGKENADSNIMKKPSRTRKGESLVDSISTKSSCETPKSEANKIPETVTCPPAPRKPTRRALGLSCKRKLLAEFEFFESGRRQEVDDFFRSSFERISAARAKPRNVVVSESTSAADSSSSSSSPPPLARN